MKILFYFILISNLHSEEVVSQKEKSFPKKKIFQKAQNIYIDEDGDKVTILDYETKKVLSSTNEIKASNIYDDGTSTEKQKKRNVESPPKSINDKK